MNTVYISEVWLFFMVENDLIGNKNFISFSDSGSWTGNANNNGMTSGGNSGIMKNISFPYNFHISLYISIIHFNDSSTNKSMKMAYVFYALRSTTIEIYRDTYVLPNFNRR